jgi:hypothetical protein
VITLTMRTAGALLVGGGIAAAMLGAGLPRASADVPEEEIVRLSQRYAYTTCAQLTQTPDAEGVNISVGDVMDRNGIPRWAAERVVAMSVKNSCPQFLPVVQQFAPGAL